MKHETFIIQNYQKGIGKSSIARMLEREFPETYGGLSFEKRRHYVRRVIKSYTEEGEDFVETETHQYSTPEKLSALSPDGKIMSPKQFMEFYGLDPQDIKSYKLVTHTGIPYYNIASKSNEEDEDLPTLEDIQEVVKAHLSTLPPYTSVKTSSSKILVLTIADLHFGAYVEGLYRTRDYSTQTLIEKLGEIVDIINGMGGTEVHVHFLGDMIESFTGLNHINSWKGLERGMYGAEVIKTATTILHKHFLSKINNLSTILSVGGNHDRLTSNKAEDTDSGACDLIMWGLGLLGYKYEFSPRVISKNVDGIRYILTHGHDPLAKKSTKDLCWDYGEKGVFNLVMSGHLHNVSEKRPIKAKEEETIKEDAIDHRRYIVPPLFTGNDYSERLGFSSNSGFIVTQNNGKGLPHTHLFTI